MSLMVRVTAGLLSAFLAFTGCGFNPKDSGGGIPSGVEKGTVECLYSGCHDSTTATTSVYPGYNPAVSWVLGFHGNVDAESGSITGTCTDCHDPINDISDYSLLFTANSTGIIADSIHTALGLTYKPIIGCEACHGSGMEHYAYIDSTLYYGNHREPMDSPVLNVFPNPFHLLPCGPCHSPDQHTGGSSLSNVLANQYPEWYGGDGQGFYSDDGHSDSLIVETAQGMMTSTVRGVPCAVCHTVEGFVTYYVRGDTSWASSQAVIDRLISETGDTDIEDPSNAPGSAALAQVSCVSCHPSHEPGVLVRGLDGAATGTQGMANLCVKCHNVRQLMSDVGSGQSGTGGLEIPRHPQKEMFEGVNNTNNDGLRGVESLPSFLAADSAHAGTSNVPEGCAGCHYLFVPEKNPTELPLKATTGHRFVPRVENCLSSYGLGGCHQETDFLLSDGTNPSFEDSTLGSFNFASIYYSVAGQPGADHDFDGTVEPLQTEIKGMLNNLKNDLTGAGVLFDSSQGLFDLTQMASRTTTERAAAYNYDFVVGDGSLGYHNPIYVVNLLASSISVLP
ncbi:MAG: hypothetical protein RRA15_03615 [bacterium]|nr:hypothetical protein [bacterium]MDT8365563.1 hypothetical protein [bacterium]